MRAECPVLLIPKIAGIPGISKAAIAFDEVAALSELSEKTAFLRKALSLKVSFTHVAHPDPVSEKHTELDLMHSILNDAFPGYDIDIKILPTGDVTNTLLDYTLERDVDLLIMGRHPRSYLMQLLVKSEISSLLNVSCAPILVVPLTDTDQ
jgi:hypothetical protein